MFLLQLLFIQLNLMTYTYGFATKRPFDVLVDLMKSERRDPYSEQFKGLGFVTKRPFDVLVDLMKSEKRDPYSEEFNALGDLTGILENKLIVDDVDPLMLNSNGKLQINYKKSDYKPKYDPGWKFIGLGKRPLRGENSVIYDNHHLHSKENPFGNAYSLMSHYSDRNYADTKVSPLLTISTLVNFEIFKAIREGLQEAARGTVKKGEGLNAPKLFSGSDSSSNRFGSRVSMYGGRQKAMYDPGWMLTGLGK